MSRWLYDPETDSRNGKKKMDNDFILSLGYTQEEISEAEKQLLTTA